MQLTLFTDYALRSLIYLAANATRVNSVKEIAEHYNISRNHLVKVAHRLSTMGLVESSKGKGGGLRLAQDAGAIRLGDIVQQLESLDLVECFDRDTNTCRITDSCRLKHYLFDASRAFIDSLNRHTLADAVKQSELAAFIYPGEKS
jgi:Rrf2 family nitric oxide-sensitive transcriptional repressor